MLRYEILPRPAYLTALKVTEILPSAEVLPLTPFDPTAKQHLAHQMNMRRVKLETGDAVPVSVADGREVVIGDHVFYDVAIDDFRVFDEAILAGRNYKLIEKE